MQTATIVGAGLVGSLWAVYLSKAGYKVKIYERRPDLRETEISAGKSINLALSHRGWTALNAAGIGDQVREMAIPMYGRTMHDEEGNLTYQPYGQKDQCIYSVSRAHLNNKMMTMAEELGGSEILYNETCVDVELEDSIAVFRNKLTGKLSKVKSDLIFGCDGAFSAVRYNAMQKLDRFNYNQRYIDHGYKELLLPANDDGSPKMDINSLHIWPRGQFMLIALANEDNSFTCTLFMPFEGDGDSFDELTSRDKVDSFFRRRFVDFHDMMPNVADTWDDFPLSSLAIIRCFPWTYGGTALMGDAAHATVPFYGQGMNSGFEDCYVMWNLMQEHNENWPKIFKAYEQSRKPNGDAVQDLSLYNYYVMRDFVADEEFLLKKKLERKINEMYPDKYIPLYSMVSFTSIPYSEAQVKGKEQEAFLDKMMKKHDLESAFNNGKIEQIIHDLYK